MHFRSHAGFTETLTSQLHQAVVPRHSFFKEPQGFDFSLAAHPVTTAVTKTTAADLTKTGENNSSLMPISLALLRTRLNQDNTILDQGSFDILRFAESLFNVFADLRQTSSKLPKSGYVGT